VVIMGFPQPFCWISYKKKLLLLICKILEISKVKDTHIEEFNLQNGGNDCVGVSVKTQ
jgi:hypothetical protein